MMLRLFKRFLGLPPARCSSDVEHLAVTLPDGTRLATTHVWPIDCRDARTPTLLLRTPYGVTTRPPVMIWLGRALAECGYHVVIQDVRGRFRSEGEFAPFVNEADDGAACIDWLVQQPWCDGPIGMLGASYLAHAAWAATSQRPEHVGALAIAIGSSDLHPLFHPHGVFSFANALEWAAGVGEHEGVDTRSVDIERGFEFEPIREADRVARCEIDFYRTWVDQPLRDDDYWEQVRAPLPDPAPPTLLVAGYWDFFAEPQLADHARLVEQARAGRGAHPELWLGPWSHGLIAHRRFWREGMQRRAMRRIVEYFDAHLAERPDAQADHAPVHYFVCDPAGRGEWRDADVWPPEDAGTLELFIDAQSAAGEAGLAPAAPEQSGAVEFVYDPLDPTPSLGGAFFGWKAGSKDQSPLAARPDVVVLESAPLLQDFVLAGPVTARLHVAAEYGPADFAVHLVDASPKGTMLEVGDGLARLDSVPSTPADTSRTDGESGETAEPVVDAAASREIAVLLGPRSWRFRAGHRVRIHIAPAHCPRFARARPPGLDGKTPEHGRQWIFSGGAQASRIELSLSTGSRFAT